MNKLKAPAYKNMSREQLEASIKMGEEILVGEVDLVELDGRSLEVRGKTKDGKKGPKRKVEDVEGAKKSESVSAKKRKASPPAPASPISETKMEEASPAGKDKASASPVASKESEEVPKTAISKEDLAPQLKRIALSQKTPFQKKVLTALCQVPRGKYTTYGAIAKHLSTSARAVGNAMRENPFAPLVPCHRVLATGGGLGGFHGSWGRKGEEGLNDGKKRELLRGEGVRFDGKGRVVGGPWEGFV